MRQNKQPHIERMPKMKSLAIKLLILLALPIAALENTRSVSNTLGAVSDAVTLETRKYSTVTFQFTGTWVATVTFEATMDGTNYVSVFAEDVTNRTSATTATANGYYRVSAVGSEKVRARVSAYTSGTVVATAIATEGASTPGVGYVRLGGPTLWSCGLDNIGATLTECQAAPGAGLKLYISGVVAQSTTATAGQFALRRGTGTNCGTGTGNVLSSATATARYVSPANTIAPTFITFPNPIALPANEALCVLGVATNTTTIQVTGYTAP
jgi:hypothetical protein